MASIHAAFEEMICEMDYDSITVKELCARAMINKKTFYRYTSALTTFSWSTRRIYPTII